MHLYLNYAREHWMKAGENPPVGLILCAEKGAAEAHYALDNLPNKVLAAEYQTVLPMRSSSRKSWNGHAYNLKGGGQGRISNIDFPSVRTRAGNRVKPSSV
jgi:hypothetical protein